MCESVDYIEVAVYRSQWLDFVNEVIIHLILKQLGMNSTVKCGTVHNLTCC